jgi:hypothetical protein
MSLRRRSLFLVFLAAPLACSFADTFVMKTGDRVEGKAIKESDQSITVQRYVGDTAPFSVSPADLQEVLPDNQETADFLSLLYDTDIQTAIGPDVFNQLIDKKIPAFESKYPRTKFQMDLDQIKVRLKGEKARQTGGAVKIAGAWLTHDQVGQEKYQVSAALLHEAMEYSAAINDWPAALNAFQNLQNNYRASRAYVAGIDLALQILPEYRRICEQKLQAYRLDLLRTYLNLSASPDHVRDGLMNMSRRESERAMALISDQRQKGIQWPNATPQSEKDFSEIYAQISNELARLSQLPVASYRASIAAAIQAQDAVEAQNPALAKTFLEQARTAWPENEMLLRIETAMDAEFATAATAAQAKLDAERPIEHVVPKQENSGLIAGGVIFLVVAAIYLAVRRTRRYRRRLGRVYGS